MRPIGTNKTTPTSRLARLIVEDRARDNISQCAAAKIIGVHPSTFARWEAGSRPNQDHLTDLAAWLGVSVEEVIAAGRETP